MRRNNRIKKGICAFLLMLSLAFPYQGGMRVHAEETGQIRADVTNVYFRDAMGGNPIVDTAGQTIMLQGGQQLTILDASNSSWYKVSLTYQDMTYTGYVAATYVDLNGTEDSKENEETDTTEETTEETTDESVDAADAGTSFEDKMSAQGFPESYKVYLRKLHDQYPNWEFKSVLTGLDWNTVVSKEVNKTGQIKNLVYGNSTYPHYNWRSTTVGYNYATDTWSPYDGTTWFAASDELVSYYLDPRTYLSENYIFVFESLAYQQGAQTEAGVEAILKGSFMYQTVAFGETKTFAQIILDAAAQSGVSAYHIASRIKQEMGNTPGIAASGKSTTYPGIYNYYNIGAVDTAGGNPALKGLAWAATPGTYGRPWNSVSKSIIGGAQFLGASYIAVGQNTLYTQKFNVTNKGSLYSHQYMTNVQAPANESLINYNAYKNNNLLSSSMVFTIPVYNNMPETAMVKPADSGNPNAWLKTLTVSGYSLTPTFAINMTTDYSLIVSESISSITVSASTVNSRATIKGAGTYNLEKGTNKISLVVTAQSGRQRTYTLTVVRGTASDPVEPKDPVEPQDPVEPKDPVEPETPGGIPGDINGDGKVTVLDIVKLQRYMVGLDALTDEAKKISDLNKDGKVSVLDIVKLQRHMVGIETLK